MSWNDFRGFLSHLERAGELKTIDREVDPKFEVAAYSRRSCDVEGPAFLFGHVRGFPRWRYATAVYSSRRKVMMALGCDSEPQMLSAYRDAVRNPIPPRTVDGGKCKEVIIKDGEVDLGRVPVAWHSELDAGPYVTSAVEIAKDPDTGVMLLGIHRLQLRSKDRLAFWGPAEKRIGRAFLKCQERGKPLEIAVVIGNDPLVDLASQARVPHDVDKMAIAGGLKGSPMELVRCETIDVDVPAGAEVVVEGQMLPNSAEPEGPFGEMTGVYSGTTMSPTIKVGAITMRSDPIMHTVLAGVPPCEDGNIGTPSTLTAIYALASQACPETKAVNITGNTYYNALISIKKRHEGEAWNVISAVLGGIYQTKYCYVFDEDINIFNPHDVEWAFETRLQPHRGVHVFPVMVGAPLDPSAPSLRHTSKLGFDCTVPLSGDRQKFQKVSVPGTDRVQW